MTENSAAAFLQYQQIRRSHWDDIAENIKKYSTWSKGYYKRLADIYRFWIPQGRRILEIGCGGGNLLAALVPSSGVGVDFSARMIEIAQTTHPQHEWIEADAHDLRTLKGPFDVIILSDLIDDLWDVQKVFEEIRRLCHSRTRLMINAYSRVWELPLLVAGRIGAAKPRLEQNWLTVEDVTGLLGLADFEVIRAWQEVLWPFNTPLLAPLCNRFLVKLWPFKYFGLTNFILARPKPVEKTEGPPLVSVIVPARNESGNIRRILKETPQMGAGTEIVFVEGHSSDDTYETMQRETAAHPKRRVQIHRQTGIGKGDAVRLGFAAASGDVLMILDADLTVSPADLPRFYNALLSGKADFINGVRLVYPMEDQAMRFFNFLGNKFFSLSFSWLLGQSVKDTLCGTKVLWKDDYELIARNRHVFGNFDPFGDFDLLFGAAKLGMKIIDLPVRYRARTYGETNISRWSHGWLLLRMVAFAARRIKFT
ncbi:MAG TPA: glycosyltransferase [Smithellaceae bacterium]|nr:glycosyltransferase [Smithellaceae bacterium]